MKKALSILIVLVLVASVAAIALAESTETTDEAVVTEEETVTADAAETVYTLEDMLVEAMTDAYTRQAAYAAYAEAFSDSRSISAIDMDTQIVLLEMLLKANGVALPTVDQEVTVPETKAEAYAAIAEAESTAVTMYKTFLSQEDLAADAQIIFRSVFSLTKSNYATFALKAQAAEQAAALQELKNSDNTQMYVINNGRHGTQVVYVVTKDEATTDEDTAAAEETTEDDTTDTTDTTTEDGVSN